MRCVECNREVELRIKLHCGCTADTEDQYIQASNPQRDSMGHDYATNEPSAYTPTCSINIFLYIVFCLKFNMSFILKY